MSDNLRGHQSAFDDEPDGPAFAAQPLTDDPYEATARKRATASNFEILDAYGGELTGYPTPGPGAQQSDGTRPLRVIHVGHCLLRAGIEMWLKSLVRGINPRKIQFVRCIATSTLNDPRVVREIPAPVEIGQERSVRRAAQDCDVLLVSGPPEVAAWLGQIRPPLCVFVAHGDSIWTAKILQSCAPVIDHVIAVSQNVQRSVCDGFASSVIYNGVDTAHLTRTAPRDEVRSRFGFAPGDFVLGSVMRLSGEKCPEQLIEAISKLPPRFKLFLVGWGTRKQKLLDLANEIAPGRCTISAATENLGDYYSAFDAFCLPSTSEGFGLATLEAMFCDVPVITTRTGFAPELLDERVHYVHCESSGDSIAAQVQLLADHPRWAAGLAAEARQAAEKFGFASRMCREYETLLTRLWQHRCSKPGNC